MGVLRSLSRPMPPSSRRVRRGAVGYFLIALASGSALGASTAGVSVRVTWVALVLSFAVGVLAGAGLFALRQRQQWGRAAEWLSRWRPEASALPQGAAPSGVPAALRQRLAALADERRAWQQAQQGLLERLWTQVSQDILTGLHSRRSFTARLDLRLGAGVLAGEPWSREPVGALLLLRVRGLERLNRRAGREAGDGVLAAAGAVLRSYPDRVPGALAGRLGGTDFGLFLPVSGLAEETALAVQAALWPVAQAASPGVEVLVAGVEALRAPDASHALAQADAVLAQAEAGSATVVAASSSSGWSGDDGSGADRARALAAEAHWQAVVTRAGGELGLTCVPLRDREGRTHARLCALRMRTSSSAPWAGPRCWRALLSEPVQRARAELAAVELALDAAAPGSHLFMEVSAAGTLDPGFVEGVARRLAGAQARAAHLTLLVPLETHATAAGLHELAARWSAAGACVGVLLRGAPSVALGALAGGPFRDLAVDLRFLRGGRADAAVLACAWQLAAAARTLHWRLHALELTDAEDLGWIWEAGFDTACGTALESAG